MFECDGENCYARLKSIFREKYIQWKLNDLVLCYQPDKIWAYMSCHYQVSYLDLNVCLDLPARKSGRGGRGSSCSCLAVRKSAGSLGLAGTLSTSEARLHTCTPLMKTSISLDLAHCNLTGSLVSQLGPERRRRHFVKHISSIFDKNCCTKNY